jgi:hypothetical protein
MMSGTTQQAGAIMRYSEQHYPLLTKFRVGPDPLEAEAKNTKIEPTSSTRQAVMGMVLRQVTGDDEGQLSRELVRKWEQKRQLEALPKQVDTWFAAEFMRWLRGVSVFNANTLTPWGNANLFHIPEVLAYLKEACACRADFQRKLVHLAIFEPRTLNDAYLYYKYIVMHHGWSKEQGGPHLANNPPTPPYLTIGGALDFLDDYSLTTFQDQALAMQALNAPEPRLYGPNQDLPRPEPNAAPTAQPAPGVPPAPGDPDAHGGGHDDEDDDDDDRPPGGSVPSTAGVLATSAAIARERAEREAVAAAIAHRMALNNAAATRAQQRQAEDALEELNAADVGDGGQPPGGSVPSTAGVLATSAAIARERAAQALAASTYMPDSRSEKEIMADIVRRAPENMHSFIHTADGMGLEAYVAGMTPKEREELEQAARYEIQNKGEHDPGSRKVNRSHAAWLFASATLLEALGKPLTGPRVPPHEDGTRRTNDALTDYVQRLIRYAEYDEQTESDRRAAARTARQAPTAASPGGTSMVPEGSRAGADAPMGSVVTPDPTPEKAVPEAGAAQEPPSTPLGKGATRATGSLPVSGADLRAAVEKTRANLPAIFIPPPSADTDAAQGGSSSSSSGAAMIRTTVEFNREVASFIGKQPPKVGSPAERLAYYEARLINYQQLLARCTEYSDAHSEALKGIRDTEKRINAAKYTLSQAKHTR